MTKQIRALGRAALAAYRHGEWIPPELRLPDTIEAIEAGQPQPVRPPTDDSRAGRLAAYWPTSRR